MEFTDEKKKQIEKDIVESAISALESGAITEDQLGDISAFVLSWIDKINDENELTRFLMELSKRWKMFEPMYIQEVGEEQEKKDEIAVDKAEAMIKEGNIDGALLAVKGVAQ